MLCDAQIHLWGANRPDRPWPAVHGEPHRALPYSAAEVLAEMDLAGVDRAVIVPPSWEGDRNDLALAAVADHPDRFAVMGRIDLNDPSVHDLSRWRETPGMLGLRLTFHRPEMRPWLTDGSADWLWREAEGRGLPVMLLAPGQSSAIGQIARRHPELRLIVDHLNLPAVVGARDIGPTIESLLALVDRENVIVKISALPCYTDEPAPFSGLQRHIRRVVDAFGADRCVWGSDLSRLPCAYREWVALFEPGAGLLDAAEAAAVGGATLCRVLDWV
jgi:predicted TIM-barrel fold metal-dependent hydrolase